MRWPWRRDRSDERASASADREEVYDPARLLAALQRHRVEYVLIGGMAVQTHGHLRTTRDVDILARPDSANLTRLASALRELDARMRGVDADLLGIDPTSPTDLAAGANFGIITAAGPLDLFTDPAEVPGARTWSQLRVDALEVRLGNLTVVVAGRDDLLAMKAATGRRKDVDDIAALTDPAAQRELEHERPSAPSSLERDARERRREPPSWER